jgi:hypothetical protein
MFIIPITLIVAILWYFSNKQSWKLFSESTLLPHLRSQLHQSQHVSFGMFKNTIWHISLIDKDNMNVLKYIETIHFG